MLASLFLLSRAQSPASDLPPDPRLDRPLAIEARIEPLPVVLARMGKELGVTLTADRRMEGLKATIFTPARPARLTLAGLASVFDAQWVPLRSGGYRLEETIPARNRREGYLELETRALREAASAYLTGPYEEPKLPIGGPLTDEDRQRITDSALANYRQISAIYRSFTPLTRERFWAGEPVSAVTGSGPAGPTSIGAARFRAENRTLEFVTIASGRQDRSGHQMSPDVAETDLQDSSFQKAQRAWRLDPKGDWPREFDRPLRPAKLPKPRWPRGTTDLDRLQPLYLQTGIPIIAEANRVNRGSSGLYSEPTLFAALRGPRRPSGSFRFEAGALLQRLREFWRERLQEPSEAALAPIERDDEPTIDDYAKTFAALPRSLLTEIYSRVARRDLFVHSLQAPGLIVWGSLSDAERAAARAGNKIPLSGLPASTRGRIEDALLESVLDSTGWIIVPGEPGQATSGEAFAFRLALLGLGRPRALSLSFEADVEEVPLDPRWPRAPNARPERRGGAIWVTDAAGAGVRYFIPRLDPPAPK